METSNQETYVFVCQPTIDGILTGIYDAWAMSVGTKQRRGCGHARVRLELSGSYNYALFCRYVEVTPDFDKAEKVTRSIQNKLSYEIFRHCILALYSQSDDRADSVYRFLILAFRIGPRVMERFGDPVVMRVFELHRSVSDEAHLLYGFVRFAECQNHLLAAQVSPKNDLLELLAAHFAERMSAEHWLIYDKKRKRCAIFHPEYGLIFKSAASMPSLPEGGQDSYANLWKAFYNSVTIQERYNPRCQRTNLPLHFRSNMTEFQ